MYVYDNFVFVSGTAVKIMLKNVDKITGEKKNQTICIGICLGEY